MGNFSERSQGLGLDPLDDSRSPIVIGRPFLIEVDELSAEKIIDRKIEFTVDKACDYINLPVWEGERDVQPDHVQSLLSEMERGRFNWDIVIVAKCRYGDKVYKINGQHTSWARIGLPNDPSPNVREIIYTVNDSSQLKALYSTFDRAKPRTDQHLTKVELAGSEATAGLWGKTTGVLSSAVKFWRYPNREEYRRVGSAELARLIMTEHANIFNLVGNFFQNLDQTNIGIIQKQPVLAAMFDNFNKVPTVAPDFWKDVAEGTNLVKDDAKWHVHNYLGTTALNRSSANSMKRIVDAEEMYRMCIAGWNKWRGNEKVQRLVPTQRRVKSA